MRILLDHCVPVDLAAHISGHDVFSVRQMGWQDLDDRELLDAMAGHFDVLLTVDSSIPYQQALADNAIAIVVLLAVSNRVGHLARLIPQLSKVLRAIAPGEIREVS